MSKGDWKIDPSLQTGVSVRGIRGCPPEGHPRRCQGKKRNQKQCPQWAVKGSSYCKRHGGHQPKTHMSSRNRNLYTRKATTTLKAALAAFQENADERVSLESEIDVSRTLAEQAVILFDQSHFGDKSEKISPEAKAAARAGVRASLTHVSELIAQHAKVMALASSTFTPEQVDQLVMQITRILERWLLPDHKTAFDAIVAEMANLRTTTKTEGKTVVLQIA